MAVAIRAAPSEDFMRNRIVPDKDQLPTRADSQSAMPILAAQDRATLIDAARGKKFVVVGEWHAGLDVVPIIEPLMGSGQFKGIFLEAFDQGGELKHTGRSVYNWNPDKYEEIVSMAKANNIEVHGIDVKPAKPFSKIGKAETEQYYNARVEAWADHISSVSEAASHYLILVGSFHVIYTAKSLEIADTENLPARLFRQGVKPSEVLTITCNPYPTETSKTVSLVRDMPAEERVMYSQMADVLYCGSAAVPQIKISRRI